jgi:CCR4-NOT transcriptional complex subunit CAF120
LDIHLYRCIGIVLLILQTNIEGKPNPDRTWAECFAQLVGTVLSLWDAAELDAAGEDGEVLPKFINLTDASIKVVRHSHVLCSSKTATI